MDRIIIIDGNSLINRAFYAMQRPMITREGIYTQGIYGFLNMLTKIEEDYAPTHMAVAWDLKAPTFRHKAYGEYKAGRKSMPAELAMELPIMKDIITAKGISNLSMEGFEADDIIGTVSKMADDAGMDTMIITGDKDALQLASDTVKVLITKKGITDFELYDTAKMIERYQLTPEQFVDLKGLMGDSSDNIPGIPGVGEKTGIKLLSQFGSIANMMQHTDEISNAKLRQKVEDNIQLALMSRKLAEIVRNVPLDIELNDLRIEKTDGKKLVEIYTRLEFKSFLKRLHVDAPSSNAAFDDEKTTEIIRISTADDLENLGILENGSEIILKTFSDRSHTKKPLISAVAVLAGDRYFHLDTTDENVLTGFIEVLNRKKFKISGHELVNEYYDLMFCGFTEVNTEFDTAVAQYVLDSSRSGYDLKTLVLETLHYEIADEKEAMKNLGQMDIFDENRTKLADFGLNQTLAIRRLKKIQQEEIEEKNLTDVYTKAELPLIEVLAAMEVGGFAVDRNTLSEQGAVLSERINTISAEIFSLAGEEFNINSPAQLGEILFEKLELPAGKKTKRGYSTSADILEKIKDKHPIVPLVLQYRTLSKLKSTYVDGLTPLIGFDGRIRAHFQQTVTATGRISCTEPNLQNIPVRHEEGRLLRKAFIPSDGRILVGADYSQIELRILAHLSGDENLIEAFNRGDDIHRNTAARVFGLNYEDVTSLDRSRAKAVNFGVIYGMSGFGLSEELSITRKEAERYIAEYFEKHEAVKAYMDDQVRLCRERGYTETILGRRRYINEINSSNYMTRQLGERLAMNSPIQGSAADIIKLAMIKVYAELKERNLKSKLILQVHDELIIDTSMDELEEVKELLVRNMTGAMDLKVKLESDLNTGATWYELK